MVRIGMWPGGHVTVAIYDSEKQSKQYLYESKTGDLNQLEQDILKDWRHLLNVAPVPSKGFPSLAGFPKL